jgi:hypothetical protein
MVTLNNKAQLFVVISTVIGIIVGIALMSEWRSWGAYAGSGALIGLDLVYRMLHPSPSGKSRLIAPDSGGAFYGSVPAWLAGAAFFALFLFFDRGIEERRARDQGTKASLSAPITLSAAGSRRPSLHAS